jgi:hypothetical protein
LIENSSSPRYVADVVAQAITSSKPKQRYLAGKDVKRWIDAKQNMSEDDFINVIKQR